MMFDMVDTADCLYLSWFMVSNRSPLIIMIISLTPRKGGENKNVKTALDSP